MQLLRKTILALVAAVASANVIGIDFGTEFMKVALVQPGSPLEIVTNTVSKRKSETVVAFVRGERLFASDAYGSLSRKPEQSYARLTEYLGRSETHPSIETLRTKSYFPTTTRFNESRGALAIAAPKSTTEDYGGGWDEWQPEELVAMVLTYAKDITRAYGGNVVRDCVITVPMSATQIEREALLAAAELADLRVLSLIEANTAAALQFGLDRKFDEPRKVLFYNAGSESIQASVVEYSTFVEGTKVKNKTIGQFEVLGKGWARGAGGFHVDLALAEKIADAFNEQWKKKKKGKAGDVRTLARPMAKIRASAKKTKEVLSANEKIPVNIPSLHDDIDFHMMVTRKDLEAAAADVLAKAMQPVQDALAKANATVDDLHGVEIIGGGVRVPKIQEMLRDFFAAGRTNKSDPLELGLHLNGDEAPALGAAFHGANVSTSFRVRKVGMLDYAQHALGVRMTNDLYAESVREGGGLMGFFKGGTKKKDDGDESPEDWHKRATLFKAGARLGAKPRTIAFHHDADIVCELAYDDVDKLPPGTPKTVALYNISGIAAFAADMAKQNTTGQLPRPKVQLSFTLDASGIASLSKAEVSVVEEYEVDAPPPKAEPKAEDNATAENATETNATDAAEAADAAKDDDKPAEAAAEAPTEAAADAATGEAAPEANASDANATGAAPGKVLKKKTHKRTLTVTPSTAGLRQWAPRRSDVADAFDRLAAIAAAEKERRAREGAKNDLEAAIYRVRNALDDRAKEIEPVSTKKQREEIASTSRELEDWLYEADAEPAATFNDKRTAFEALWTAVVGRAEELAARPKAIEKFRKALALAKKNATEVWPDERPWLEQEDLDALVKKADDAGAWLDDQEKAQKKLKNHEEPAFRVAELNAKLKPTVVLAARLNAKKKPVVVEDVNATNATDVNATDGNATDANATAEAESEEDAKVTEEMKDEL